ncbi:hypothetical protein ILUMI_11971 [Ignelater luminosus]|uniref:Uncharacterized protein n=1 Tax=Ignelater luminosus TaxID=2038154 RepID=A0A8K0D177_IGNLU|nr:hypothetical protein ILUMI_11971 [Ignelater luminosus]
MKQNTLSTVEKKFREYGHVRDLPKSGPPKTLDETKLNVLLAVQDNPHETTRQLGLENNIYHTTVLKILKEDVFNEFLQDVPLEVDSTVTLRGLGNSKVDTIGSFEENVEVGGEDFTLTFSVIPKSASSFKAIIGSNILTQAEISIRDDGIRDVQKNDEPIYQHPRRLSPTEKVEVEKQVEEWLEKGIVRPGCSDYASPILQKRLRNPTRVITDKGTAFTTQEFKTFCEEQEIEHVTITTGVPRGNDRKGP